MSKAKILVVDDDETTCEALKLMLGLHDYAVETANSAVQALDILGKQTFDMVLADLAMPGMDGLDLLSEVKRQIPPLPVVIITAYPAADNVIQALRRGANDFVTKPYYPGELLAIIRREVSQTKETMKPLPSSIKFSPYQMEEINTILGSLRGEASARCVLVVDHSGQVIAVKGSTEDLDVPVLAEMAATDFAASANMANLIGEGDAFRMNFHEGARFSVYTANLSAEVFLLVVFGQDIRSGMVQYTIRQALVRLQAVITPRTERPSSTRGLRPSDIQRATALDLYKRKLLSIDKAANMAGVSLQEFIDILDKEGLAHE